MLLMTRTIILSAIVAATLMTGLLVGSFPTTNAETCLPPTKHVTVSINGDPPMGPFDIDSYTATTEVDKSKKKNMFMFTHEVDDMLSAKMLAALNNGDVVDIHITMCQIDANGIVVKMHTVWLTGGTVTSVSETSDDSSDDFPKEKIKGTFTEIKKMTEKFEPGTG